MSCECDLHDAREAMYAMWRFAMWSKGYGSYVEIDEAVHRGELDPGKDYPSRRAQPQESSRE